MTVDAQLFSSACLVLTAVRVATIITTMLLGCMHQSHRGMGVLVLMFFFIVLMLLYIHIDQSSLYLLVVVVVAACFIVIVRRDGTNY